MQHCMIVQLCTCVCINFDCQHFCSMTRSVSRSLLGYFQVQCCHLLLIAVLVVVVVIKEKGTRHFIEYTYKNIVRRHKLLLGSCNVCLLLMLSRQCCTNRLSSNHIGICFAEMFQIKIVSEAVTSV